MSARITDWAMAAASIGHRIVLQSYCEIVKLEIRVQDHLTLRGISATADVPPGYV